MLDVGAPEVVEYVPISHLMHVLDVVAPTKVEYVLIWQSSHISDPANSLYFPATHSKHVPPSGPVEPALQVQAVSMELPDGDDEWVGHISHVYISVAPTVVE